MSLTRFRCATSLKLGMALAFGTKSGFRRVQNKTKGPCGNRTRDLSHPKGESYL